MLKTRKNSNVLCRVSSGRHSAKWALPSVLGWHSAKNRKVVFAECPGWHSAKKASLPSAADLALGKSFFKNKKKSLPSAASRALGKEHELSRSNGFSLFSLSLTLTLAARPRRPLAAGLRARARSPPPAAGHLAAGLRARARLCARAARAPKRPRRPLAARPCRPLAARPRAAHDHRRTRADDLHAVNRSRPPRRHARSPSCTVHAEQIGIN
jgi:hypothetical protein